jgi:hypothetical protein
LIQNVDFLNSLLKALHIITPSHGLVLSKDLLNSMGSIQAAVQDHEALQDEQTQMPSLPARYAFNTWVS